MNLVLETKAPPKSSLAVLFNFFLRKQTHPFILTYVISVAHY